MKQIYLMSAALAMSVACNAQMTSANRTYQPHIPMVEHSSPVVLSTASTSMAVTDIITDAPGTSKAYLRASHGIFLQWGTNLTEYTEEGTSVEVVFGDDNEIYLKNIMSYGATNTYVKGTIEGDKITVTLPQTVIYDEYAEDYVNLVKLVPYDVEGGQFTYVPDTECTSYTYTLKEDGSFTMDDLGWMNGIGFSFASDNTWAGYLDYTQIFTPFDGELVEVPEGLPLQSWACTTPSSAFTITVAMDNSEFYVRGLCTYFADSWVRGRIEGDKVYIANNQYLGLYDNIYFIYLMFGHTDPETHNQTLDPVDTEFVFEFDADRKKLIPVDETQQMFFNTSFNKVYYLDFLDCPVLTSQESYSGIPSDPYGLIYDESNRPYYGYSAFRFYLPVVTDEGSVLDAAYMYYNVFVDGELLEIDKDIYIDITENMTDIPYYFSNSFDVWDRGYNLHQVGIYLPEVHKLGVQSVYKYDDTITRSNYVELEVAPTGFETTLKTNTVVDIEWTDLTGRRVVNPVDGMILIRRVTYSDGTTRTDKFVKR